MKKTFGFFAIIWALFLALFNVIVFVAPNVYSHEIWRNRHRNIILIFEPSCKFMNRFFSYFINWN